ncbi:response regulator transcription factor [Geobacillus thermodenitrificans]|uniref:response regulator transcription factor n=1 Tax=Geobacillus thermodenitrificans TaxID=33940 RepID=UPI003D19AF4C
MCEAYNAEEAFDQLRRYQPDLIILDVRLPDLDGIELCRQIRHRTDAPILFLSCKDSELDKVVGLNVGGDDYVGKPFSIHELLARIQAHLRRYKSHLHSFIGNNNQVLRSDSILLNPKEHECYVRGEPIFLTTKEFQLLHFLMKHPRQVFNADHLLEKVWGRDSETDIHTVMVHIGRLRKKIEKEPKHPSIIITIRGTGYKFNEKVQ